MEPETKLAPKSNRSDLPDAGGVDPLSSEDVPYLVVWSKEPVTPATLLC